jgi:hypothetical protein
MDSSLVLRAVREISMLINPEQPTTITQRAFDATRSQSAVPNVPAAKRIVERLNARRRPERLTWAGVLALAHTTTQDQDRTISTQEADVQTWLTDRQISFALTYVSIRLNTKAFTQETYEHELERMRDEGIRVDELRLPSSSQIVRAMARKLRQREDALPAGLRLRRRPSKRSSASRRATSKPVKRKRRPISETHAWKAALEMAGLQQVERAYLSPATTVPASETRRTGWTDIDACLVDACAYLEQLPAGKHSTYPGFQRWVQAQGRTMPPKDAIRKHGGWVRVRKIAQERLHPGLKDSKDEDQADEQTGDADERKRLESARKTRTRAKAPEPAPLEPIDRLRAMRFRPARPKKHQAPRRKPTPSRTRTISVQSGRVQASKRSGQAPKSGSPT